MSMKSGMGIGSTAVLGRFCLRLSSINALSNADIRSVMLVVVNSNLKGRFIGGGT